jgi:CBS domain-containing membrane protein
VAGAVAVGISIYAMYYLRCMHPPGGATALLAVIGGESLHAIGFQFLLSPILINVIIMLACAWLYRWLADIHQHHPYQSSSDTINLDQNWARSEQDWLVTNAPFSDENLSQAIAAMDTFIDISRQDLKEIFAHAIQYSHTHSLGELQCHEVMSSPAISVEYDTELENVWRLFEEHNIRGLPVINKFNRIIGIVTVSNFVHNASQMNTSGQSESTIAEQLSQLRKRTPGFESDKPEVAGQIMTAPVITAQRTDRIADLAPLFTMHAIHHIPVIDEKRKLVGILTREDILAVRAN